MTRLRTAVLLMLLSVAATLLSPAAALAAEPVFGQPSATADLGQPITVTSTISGGDIASVDVVLHLTGNPTAIVLSVSQVQPAGTWQAQAQIDVATSSLCACLADGQSSPNTKFDYHFRVHAADGTTIEGPVGQATVEDTRFTWQVLEQDLVIVHWYAGDEQFARNAASVANEAIDRASQLLGVTLPAPVDLFVYDTEEAMREAVSPNRENVAGEAHPDIRTMFVHVPANASVDAFAGVLIRHELTHLVFHEAIDNDYHGVPRWLDEGVAVYLSEGYTQYWHQFVDPAVANHSLIPLDGLRGLFPSTTAEFYLAYGEAVAAVDYFVRTYGEPQLWDLVRSYAQGVSDDEAFSAATGGDVAAFNQAWFNSLGLEPQAPVGPQAGAPGPTPQDWSGEAPATTPPSTAPGSGAPASAAPGTTPTATPGPTGTTSRTTDVTEVLIIVALIVFIVLASFLIVVFVQRNNSPRPPSF